MTLFKKLRSKTLYRYLLSYLIIFSIPFLALSFVVYKSAVVNLKTEIENAKISKLELVKNMIDMRFEELRNISARISFDHRLTPYKVRNLAETQRQAIMELAKYKANSAIIDEIFLYFRGDDIMYSSKGVESLSTIDKYSYNFEKWNHTQLKNDLNSADQPIVKPAQEVFNKHKRVLAYLNPIPPQSNYPHGMVMFLIEESVISRFIEDILGDFKGSVYILDEHNQLLASDTLNSKIPVHTQKVLENLDETGVYNIQMDNEELSFMNVKSDDSGWRFVTVIPSNQFLGKIAEVKTFIMSVLAIIIFIGIASSVMLSLRNYRPIKELYDQINIWGQNAVKGQKINEFEHIKDNIERVYTSHKDLLDQMERNRPLLREQFLGNVLKGNYKNLKEVDQLLKHYHMKMEGPQFFVFYVLMEKQLINQNREDFLQEIDLLQLSDGKCYGIELINEKAVAIIVNLNEQEDIRKKQTEIADSIIRLFKQLENTPTIGVGKTYRDILQLNRSFIEASAATEYKLLHSKNIIYFDDIKDLQEQTSWYPVEEQVRLTQSLKQGDNKVAQDALKTMMKSIAEQEQSVLLLKCMCFEVVNTIFKTVTEMNLNEFDKDIKQLLEFPTLKELESSLNLLLIEICSKVQQNKENQNNELRNDILQYINDHYTSYDMSLGGVADKFQLSGSYLSRYIKDQTGFTFTEYVFNLRMQLIKQELKETTKPIKEIVNNVGYVDLPNFSRKFKKVEGITPGQYRKHHTRLVFSPDSGSRQNN